MYWFQSPSSTSTYTLQEKVNEKDYLDVQKMLTELSSITTKKIVCKVKMYMVGLKIVKDPFLVTDVQGLG